VPAAKQLCYYRSYFNYSMIFITFNTISELACFLAGLIFLFKDKDPAWRLLIWYLLLTCIVEVAGIYIRTSLHVSNIPLYNLSVIPECFATSYFFYSLYKAYHPKIKWLIIWLSIFLIMYFTELVYNCLRYVGCICIGKPLLLLPKTKRRAF